MSQEIYNVEIPHTSLGPGDGLARKVSVAKAIETTDKVICTAFMIFTILTLQHQTSSSETVQDMMKTITQMPLKVAQEEVICRHQLEQTKRSCQVCFECQVSLCQQFFSSLMYLLDC